MSAMLGAYYVTCTIIHILGTNASPGEEFLHSIVSKLQESRPTDNHKQLYEQKLATSRSAAYYPQKYGIRDTGLLQHPESQLLHQASGDDGHLADNAIWDEQQQQQQQLDPQPSYSPEYHLNSILLALQQARIPFNRSHSTAAAPYIQLSDRRSAVRQSESVPEPTTPSNVFDKTIPNSFYLNNVDQQHQTYIQPTLEGNNGLNGEISESNQYSPAVYYVYNPTAGNTVGMADDNLNDNTLNAASPHHNTDPLDAGSLDAMYPMKGITVEPLFVAMAGFVSVAMIFMSAVLFLPKIFTPASKATSLKGGPQELQALTKLAIQAIEGNDCTERIACEVGRAMRNLQVGSKQIKVLEVLLPANVAGQLVQIRKALADKKSCKLIRCKPLKGNDKLKLLPESKQTKNELLAEIVQSRKPADNDGDALEPSVQWTNNKGQKKVSSTITPTKKPVIDSDNKKKFTSLS